MIAADLDPKRHAGKTITWHHNGIPRRSRPFAIEHAAGFTYLHIDGYKAHELRSSWEVEVTP